MTVGKMAWHRLAGFFPHWIMKRIYPPDTRHESAILLFTAGGTSGGRQLNVTRGRPLSVESNELMVINVLPFSVDPESAKVEVLLGGMQLASKETNFSLPIRGMSAAPINLRFELNDNQ